jgi:hypothetical protein
MAIIEKANVGEALGIAEIIGDVMELPGRKP